MLDIDPEVFKLLEPRILSLLSGKMSVAALVYTIRPGDWLIMINDTVYALTEVEYYAVQHVKGIDTLEYDNFFQLLADMPKELSEEHRNKLNTILSAKMSCSTCKYNTYKHKVQSMLVQYPLLYTKYVTIDKQYPVPAYPKCSEKIKSKVTDLIPSFFTKVTYERKPCLDCVLKHITMAIEKGYESQQGYPLYLSMCLANLQEAYELSPQDCKQLKSLLLFCIGKTKKDSKPFIPWGCLKYLIDLSREDTFDLDANDQNQPDESFDLLLDDQTVKELASIPTVSKAPIMKLLTTLLKYLYSKAILEEPQRFQGLLGILSDSIVIYSVGAANILRNRRLMFKSSPILVRNSVYDCRDFLKAILSTVSDISNSSEK